MLPLQLPSDFDGMLGANFFMDRYLFCLDVHQRREVRVPLNTVECDEVPAT